MANDDRIVLGRLLVALYKGVIYRDSDEETWSRLLQRQNDVQAHVSVLGLELTLDEAEGFAYLRTPPSEGDPEIPRLAPRRQLSYLVSLVLVLLRKRMLEADRGDGASKLVLDRDALVEVVRVFLPASNNDAKLADQVMAAVTKIEDLGFLRRMNGPSEVWEVRRVLKAFVDGQWLADLDQRLETYRGVKRGGEE